MEMTASQPIGRTSAHEIHRPPARLRAIGFFGLWCSRAWKRSPGDAHVYETWATTTHGKNADLLRGTIAGWSPTNHTAHLRPVALRSPLEPSVSHACFAAQARILDRLNNLETLEFRMPEIEGF